MILSIVCDNLLFFLTTKTVVFKVVTSLRKEDVPLTLASNRLPKDRLLKHKEIVLNSLFKRVTYN